MGRTGQRSFVGAGFVVLPGLLSAVGLRQARVAADRAVAAPDGLSCERPNNTLVPLRWDSPLVELMLGESDRIAEAVDARDLRWISGYVSVKDPHSPWDHPVSFQREATQVAVLCYLTDTRVDTGALRVIPGSHVASVPLHGVLPEAHSDDSRALDLAHPAMTDDPDQITFELRAGDAVALDYRLLHGTHAHAGSRRRDCVLINFAPHWSDLPPDIKRHLVCHPALPGTDDPPPGEEIARLLPNFDGPRGNLPLNRNPPTSFGTH